MEPYRRNVKYYETDKMGIVHHSNYIRWMEEARLDVMERLGFGFDKIEKTDVVSPVVEVSCKYKSMTYFNDNILIDVFLEEINKVKFVLEYKMYDENTKEIKATGKSTHCFTDKTGRIVNMEKQMKDFYEALKTIK